MTSSGKPYAPFRYEAIVKEQYLISKMIHTSVNDLDNITPKERDLLLKFIVEEQEATAQKIQEKKAKHN